MDYSILVLFLILFILCSLAYANIFMGCLLFLSAILGFLIPFIFLKDRKELPSLLSLIRSKKVKNDSQGLTRSCSICEHDYCNRRQNISLSNSAAQAHVNFTVTQSFDQALDEFLTMLMDQFIYSWYEDISLFDLFANDLRYAIRFAASSIGYRLSKVDFYSLIFNHLLPCGLHHLNCYILALEKMEKMQETGQLKLSEENLSLEDRKKSTENYVLRFIHSNGGLHPALCSRKDEQNYLRGVFSALYPYLTPKIWRESSLTRIFTRELFGSNLFLQGMDLLAHPDTVNFLFLQLLSEHTLSHNNSEATIDYSPTLLLKSFSRTDLHSKNSRLRCDLSKVLKDQNLLYSFHDFLKKEGAISVLSFCLAVEDFNRHLLDPSLDENKLKSLHEDGRELYHTYMAPGSACCIDFPPDIVLEIKEIVHGCPDDVVKLRTTRPLFQAYEFGYNLLEHEFLPHFTNSKEYFDYLCGEAQFKSHSKKFNSRVADPNRQSTITPGMGAKVARKVGSGLASLGRQVALKPAVVVGQQDTLPQIHEAQDASHDFKTEEVTVKEIAPSSKFTVEGFSHNFRDLSAWRISIPKTEQIINSEGKVDFIFLIDVKRVDVTGEASSDQLHWVMQRRYLEFYVLESKLTEFHGHLIDCSLPPRGGIFSSFSKDVNFVSSRRKIFEEFLMKLLQKPFLKKSQLLFLFLKSEDEFSASLLPDFSLANLLKEVPKKLLKEKGQSLEPFITKFIKSAVLFHSSENGLEEEGYGILKLDTDSLITNLQEPKDNPLNNDQIFGDNCRGLLDDLTNPVCSSVKASKSLENLDGDSFKHLFVSNFEKQQEFSMLPLNLTEPCEVILYLAMRVFKLSRSWLQWIWPLKMVLGKTLDCLFQWYLKRKLDQALSTASLVNLIHAIKDDMFPKCPKEGPQPGQTEEELRANLQKFLPQFAYDVLLNKEAIFKGCDLIVDVLQHPVLNKQLCYSLLNLFLREVFPEIEEK